MIREGCCGPITRSWTAKARAKFRPASSNCPLSSSRRPIAPSASRLRVQNDGQIAKRGGDIRIVLAGFRALDGGGFAQRRLCLRQATGIFVEVAEIIQDL